MPQIPTDFDKPAKTDTEIIAECAERLRIAVDAEGENRNRGIAALEFLDGHQWADDLYNQRKIARRPSLTINHTATFRKRVVNNMRQQRPRIMVHPVGDGADVDKANVIKGLIRHIENQSNADIAYDTAGASAVDIGWGYFRLVADYVDPSSMEQEIRILPVRNTFTVYMDPASVMPAGEDAEWVIITEKMKRTEFKRQYPDEKLVDYQKTQGVGDDQAMWETKTEIRVAEYYRITRKPAKLYALSNGMTAYADELAKLKPLMEGAQVTVVGERMSHKRIVQWYKLNGLAIVDTRDLPGEYIPVVRCEGNTLELNGRTRRKGMIADLMDPARMYNYWRTAETEQLALASKAPWIGSEQHFDGHPEWDDANQTPYSKLTYNDAFLEQPDGSKTPLPPPQRQPAIEVPAGFVQAAQGAQQDLMAVAGMPHEPGQDTPGSVVSGVALEKRQALSDIGHFQYYDNQTRAIAHGGRIILSWIPVYYSAQKMQRIIGDDGTPQMTAINTPDPAIGAVKNDLTVGKYDVVMDTGPGYDTKRQEGAEAVIDLLKTPLGEPIVKVGADLIVRNMDFAGAQDLADRLMPMNPEGMQKTFEQLPKQAQAIVKAVMQQSQQKDQLIQHLQLELKYKSEIEKGWQKVELQKAHMSSEVKAHDTEISNETKRFDTHVKSVTARDVAEINAGARLIDSNQDRSHEKELAKMTADAAEKAEKNSIQ
jgi:hypothetical protein